MSQISLLDDCHFTKTDDEADKKGIWYQGDVAECLSRRELELC
jgi:hypothetical protein